MHTKLELRERNMLKHIPEWEVENMFAMGLEDKIETIYQEHFSKCYRCLSNFEKIRDRYRGLDLDIPLVELSRKRNEIIRDIPYEWQEIEKKQHPVLVHASDKSYVIRIPRANPTAMAAFIKNILMFMEDVIEEKGQFLAKAGELNWYAYEKLREEYHINSFIESTKKVEGMDVIAGSFISVRNEDDINSVRDIYRLNTVLGIAKQYPYKAKLKIKREGRERYHYIIHSKSNKIALVEDYHEEYNERGTTIVYEDPELCEFLREDFCNTSKSEEVFEWNLSIKEIQGRLKQPAEYIIHRYKLEEEQLGLRVG